MKILVTGATGFVGRRLCAKLIELGYAVSAATRNGKHVENCASFMVGEINGATHWEEALRGVDVAIHLAARVHVMREDAVEPLSEFRRINVAGTERLARSAAASGVKRLVYVSSIKVNGEETSEGQCYKEGDVAAPQDAYGVSKWEAEQALHRIGEDTGLGVVIVRPPLVYGPGVKGNFAQMMQALARGWPLPLASVNNRRDLLYIGNLVDALILCATHPAAAGHTYLLSDGEAISTPQLLRELAAAMQVRAHLLPFPQGALRLFGRLAGRSGQVERLLGSLQVDAGKIRADLHWTPPYSLHQGLRATAEHYRSHT